MKSSCNVRDIYSLMSDSHIQFSYKGPITQDVLISLGDTIKEKLHREDCDAKVIRRVFSVLVEAAHNILKYSYEKTDVDSSNRAIGVGLIGLGKTENRLFTIFSGNLVTQAEMNRIEAHLKHINSLSGEEINRKYHQQLKHGKMDSAGGAGLGLLEVARKSSCPIDYHFTAMNNGLYFFEMKVFVEVED